MVIIRTKCKKASGHSTHEKFYIGSDMKELINKINLIVLDMYHESIDWAESGETDTLSKGMEILAIKNVEEYAVVLSETFSGTRFYGFMVEVIQPEE